MGVDVELLRHQDGQAVYSSLTLSPAGEAAVRRSFVRAELRKVAPGDVELLKGKGHYNTVCIAFPDE
jgi:hypothetical protein